MHKTEPCHACKGSLIIKGIGGMPPRVCPYCNGTKERIIPYDPAKNPYRFIPYYGCAGNPKNHGWDFFTLEDLLKIPIVDQCSKAKGFSHFAISPDSLNIYFPNRGFDLFMICKSRSSWSLVGHLRNYSYNGFYHKIKIDLPAWKDSSCAHSCQWWERKGIDPNKYD